MATSPLSWKLVCPWCPWYCIVYARGMRGRDAGAGVEAANALEAHVMGRHGRTWREFLAEPEREQ